MANILSVDSLVAKFRSLFTVICAETVNYFYELSSFPFYLTLTTLTLSIESPKLLGMSLNYIVSPENEASKLFPPVYARRSSVLSNSIWALLLEFMVLESWRLLSSGVKSFWVLYCYTISLKSS